METIANIAIIAAVALLLITICIVFARCSDLRGNSLAHGILGFIAWPVFFCCCIVGIAHTLLGLLFDGLVAIDSGIDRLAEKYPDKHT